MNTFKLLLSSFAMSLFGALALGQFLYGDPFWFAVYGMFCWYFSVNFSYYWEMVGLE
jgi:hypothetical protein